jgi:transposase
MKAALVRLGIRGFNPKPKRATRRFDGLRTPAGEPIPPNALAELRRDMERRRLVNNQIRQIEEEPGGVSNKPFVIDRTSWCAC